MPIDMTTQATATSQQSRRCESATDMIADIIADALESALAGLTLPDLLNTTKCRDIRDLLFAQISLRFQMENKLRGPGDKFKKPDDLPAWAVARIVLSTGDVRVLIDDSGVGEMLAIKNYYANASTGYRQTWAGDWAIIDPKDASGLVFKVLRTLCPSARRSDRADFIDALTDAPRAYITPDPNLIYFRNGVWDCTNRTFTAYTDPAYDATYGDKVTLAKLPICFAGGPNSPVQLNPDGSLPDLVLHNDKDGTDWRPLNPFTDPFDMNTDLGKACNKLLLQTAQFVLRRYNGRFGFYQFWINANARGRNGKGVLSDLLSAMITRPRKPGDDDLRAVDRVAVCGVEEIGAPYILSRSIRTAYMILGEESESNSGRAYITDTATFKLLSRGQAVTYRNIYEAPFNFAYKGVSIQQSNGAPIFTEKNESVISHIFCVPFVHCFDDESRAYIKTDYVKREEVATWLAYYVTAVLPTYEDYDQEAVTVLKPYREDVLAGSMNTVAFMDECLAVCPMDTMPAEMLYSFYTRWAEQNGYTGNQVVAFRAFREDMQQYAILHPEVQFTTKPQRVKGADISNPNRASYYWGFTTRQGYSEYSYNSNLNPQLGKHTTLLRVEAFVNPGGNTRRQFSRGCFVRTAGYTMAEQPWWDNDAKNYIDKED